MLKQMQLVTKLSLHELMLWHVKVLFWIVCMPLDAVDLPETHFGQEEILFIMMFTMTTLVYPIQKIRILGIPDLLSTTL